LGEIDEELDQMDLLITKFALQKDLPILAIWVNGKHHQAIKDLTPTLIVSARAEEGVIEAVENPSLKFVIGGQWHPAGTWKSDIFPAGFFRPFSGLTSINSHFFKIVDVKSDNQLINL